MNARASIHDHGSSSNRPIFRMSTDSSQRESREDQEDLKKIGAFLAGDQTAFEFLFDKYRERVFNVAFRFVRNKDDALEVTQDVFIRAYQALEKFKTDSKFYTWLYRIATNRAIDYLRTRKAKPAISASVLDDAVGSEGSSFTDRIADTRTPDPSEHSQRHEIAQGILAAVEELTEKHRVVFLLHAVEQLAYKEIAEVVGCSIGTVMSRLFYARKKLQELLKDYT